MGLVDAYTGLRTGFVCSTVKRSGIKAHRFSPPPCAQKSNRSFGLILQLAEEVRQLFDPFNVKGKLPPL